MSNQDHDLDERSVGELVRQASPRGARQLKEGTSPVAVAAAVAGLFAAVLLVVRRRWRKRR